jgi:hypothetical protein
MAALTQLEMSSPRRYHTAAYLADPSAVEMMVTILYRKNGPAKDRNEVISAQNHW